MHVIEYISGYQDDLLIIINVYFQGQGRIEKTEIIEMAIKHINNLTSIVNKQGGKDTLKLHLS